MIKDNNSKFDKLKSECFDHINVDHYFLITKDYKNIIIKNYIWEKIINF